MENSIDLREVLRHQSREVVVATDTNDRHQIVRAADGVHLGDLGSIRELLRDVVDPCASDVHQND